MSPVSFLRKALALGAGLMAISASAQITLTGTSYTENFNSIGSGLSSGWSVYTSATSTTLGTADSSFATATTLWNAGTASTYFRNIASNDIATSANTATQNGDTNRAFGWRPLGATAPAVQPSREGALTLAINNTTGFQNFSLSVTLFTANDVSGSQNYALEYRVGNSGSFTSLGSYTTTTPFGSSTLTADSITLSALNNQSSSVYIRVRGTSTTGSSNLDTLGIDNFSLSYSATAVPEPSTYAAVAGVLALGGVMWQRRRSRVLAAKV